MNKPRIKKVSAYLKAHVRKKGFDMNTWSRVIEGSALTMEHVKKGFSCGMVACLTGHTVVVFPRLLRFGDVGTFGNHASVYSRTHNDSAGDPLEGWAAFGAAMDICDSCARALTDPGSPHRKADQAAKTLDKFVAMKPFKIRGGMRVATKKCKYGVENCCEVELW